MHYKNLMMVSIVLFTASLNGSQELCAVVRKSLGMLYANTQVHATRLYVLTGGPGTGKSSTIEELANRGQQTIKEAYTTLYEKAAKENKIDAFFEDPLQLHYNLMREQLKAEEALDKEKSAFLDRSVIDIVTFGDYLKVNIPDDLKAQADREYELVFLLEPLPSSCYKKTEIRKETEEESHVIHNILKEAYKRRGYILVDVPFGTPASRAQFILNCVARHENLKT